MKAARLVLALLAIGAALTACGATLYLGDVPRFLGVLFAGTVTAAMAWPEPEACP